MHVKISTFGRCQIDFLASRRDAGNTSYEGRLAMKLDFSINMGQRQGLTLTAQVQQAIKLLQMTNLEVNEYIEETFTVNPLSN